MRLSVVSIIVFPARMALALCPLALSFIFFPKGPSGGSIISNGEELPPGCGKLALITETGLLPFSTPGLASRGKTPFSVSWLLRFQDYSIILLDRFSNQKRKIPSREKLFSFGDSQVEVGEGGSRMELQLGGP